MTNGTDHTNGDSRTDELLNRMIRAAAQRTPSEFTWPQDEIILAYILGKATEAQRDEVQAAVAQSPELRRFLVDTAAQLSAATTDTAAEAFDGIRVPASLAKESGSQAGSLLGRLLQWLGALRHPRVLAPVLAGAAAIFIILSFDPIGLFAPRTELLAQHSELDRSLFVSMSTRNGLTTDSIPTAAASPYEAAVERLRESVAYDLTTGTYKMTDGSQSSMLPETGRTLVLRLTDKHGNEIRKIAAPVYGHGDLNAEAWIILPPAMTLWHLTLPADSLDIEWPLDRPARGCATFTQQTDSGFIATPGKIFQL